MPLTVWLGSAAVSASLIALWWALAPGQNAATDRAREQLRNVGPSDLRSLDLDRPPVDRLLGPVATGVGRRLTALAPTSWTEQTERRLGAAGLLGRWTPEQILGARALATVVLGAIGILRFAASPSVMGFVWMILLVGLGFFGIDALITSIGDRRKETIERDLPDLLDQLTISVEAGLGFEAALARIGQDNSSPLAQEFGRMVQDIGLGVPRSDALAALGTRTDVDDMRHLVLALRQAERLGVPLGKTLRSQAVEVREKRRFRAEEAAHKLPVKMIFPLGLCILPALFIVILGPAMLQIRQVFGF